MNHFEKQNFSLGKPIGFQITKNGVEKIHQSTFLGSQLSTFGEKTLNQTQNLDPYDQNRTKFYFFCHWSPPRP